MNIFRNEFERRGFIEFKNAGLDKPLLERAKHRVEQVLDGSYETGAKPWSHFGDGITELTRLSQIHMTDQVIFEAITQSKIGELAALLTGSKVIKVWGCQLFHKPKLSNSKGNVGFHRDSQHMPFFKKGVLTAWLPLTNVGANSGPLTVVEGSHLWDRDDYCTGGEIQSLDRQVKSLKDYYNNKTWDEKDIILDLGGVSFHSFDVLHGSYPNKSSLDRSVLTIGLITDSVELDEKVEDYGYSMILSDEKFCPTIYSS